MGQIMKQVQDMQAKMAKMQENLGGMSSEGASGGGLVKAVMNGKGEVKSLKIDPSLLNPAETDVLEDMILAALAAAKTDIDALVAKETEKIMGGVKLPPGMKLPF